MADLSNLRKIVYKTIEDSTLPGFSSPVAKIAEFAQTGYGIELYVTAVINTNTYKFLFEVDSTGKYLVSQISFSFGNPQISFGILNNAIYIKTENNFGGSVSPFTSIIVRKEIKYGNLTDSVISDASSVQNILWVANINTGSSTQIETLKVDGNANFGTSLANSVATVTGQLNIDDVRLDGETVSSLNDKDLKIQAASGKDVVVVGGAEKDFLINDGATPTADNKFTVSSTTGNTVVKGTLDVINTTTMTGLLNANGGIAVLGVGVVNGELTIDKLKLDGNAISTTADTEDLVLSAFAGKDVVVSGGTNKDFVINDGATPTSVEKFKVSSTTGNTDIEGTLKVTGVTTLNNALATNLNTFNLLGKDLTTNVTYTVNINTGDDFVGETSESRRITVIGTNNINSKDEPLSVTSIKGLLEITGDVVNLGTSVYSDVIIRNSANDATIRGILSDSNATVRFTIEQDGDITTLGTSKLGNIVINPFNSSTETFSPNTITTLNSNGSINLDPNGSGVINFYSDLNLLEASNLYLKNGSGTSIFSVEGSTGNTTIAGTLKVNNTTGSTSKDTGSIVIEGGVGIEEKLYVGDKIYENGVRVLTAIAGNTLTTGDALTNVTIDPETSQLILTRDKFLHLGSSGVGNSIAQTAYGEKTFINNIKADGGITVDTNKFTVSTSGAVGIASTLVVTGVASISDTTQGVYNPTFGTATGALKVAGGIMQHAGTNHFQGSTTIGGNLTVSGDLQVDGEKVILNVSEKQLEDPIFTLGGTAALTSDDNKDRGIAFRWHNGTAAKTGFFGFDDSTGYMAFVPDATITNEVVSGNLGNIQATKFIGALEGNADTVTTAADDTSNSSRYILFADNASGFQSLKTDSEIRFNPNTNTLTTSIFAGNLSGNATTATAAATIATIRNNSDDSYFLTFVNSDTESSTAKQLFTDGNISFNPSSNVLSVPGISAGGISVSDGTNTTSIAPTSVSTASITTGLIQFPIDGNTMGTTINNVSLATGSISGSNISLTSDLPNRTTTAIFNSITSTTSGTSGANNAQKIALSITSDGTWAGTNAINRALYINAIDGADNRAIDVLNGTSYLRDVVISTGNLSFSNLYGATNKSISTSGVSGTNVPGMNLTISSGSGTGEGAGSKLIFRTPNPTTSGATAQGFSDRLAISSDGVVISNANVGIGTTDSFPVEKLEVRGNLRIGGSDTSNYIAFHGTTGDQPGDFNHTYIGERIYGGSEISELVFFKGNDVTSFGNPPPGPDRIRFISNVHVFNTYTSALSGTFNEVTAFSASTERLRIDQNGNVGIGTGTPDARLTITGNTGTWDSGMRFASTGTNARNYGIRVETDGSLRISDQSASFGPSRITILNSGNVGIGSDTTNNRKLYVNGDQEINGNLYFPSDERLKNKHATISESFLSSVLETDIWKFSYKRDPENLEIGLMAQDLEKNFPSISNLLVDAKDTEELSQQRSIKESKLVYVLWAALQEESKKRAELEHKLDEVLRRLGE